MTPDEHFNFWNTKYDDFDKAYGPQCKDVFSRYNKEFFGNPYLKGNAIQLWNNLTVQKYYTQIKNTLALIPQKGDVAIFNSTLKNPYGHVSICTGRGNWLWFQSFDQNLPLGTPCHFQNHNYIYPRVLGVLRPKINVG